MKSINFKKIIPLIAITVIVGSVFVYSKSSLAENKQADNISIELDIEKVDKDTVKISLDNFSAVAKSLQLSVKIDGDVKFNEDTIKWLVSSDMEDLKSNIKVSNDKKTMDIFIVSSSVINKIGGKVEICEVDISKTIGGSLAYRIIPNVNNDGFAYSYLNSETNKQVSGIDIANLNEEKITINTAPKINLINSDSIIEGNIVVSKGTKFDAKEYVEAIDEEDGVISKDKIIVEGNVNTNIVGSYKIKYSVSDKDGDKAELEQTVIVEEVVEEVISNPVINGVKKLITIKNGEVVDLLNGVTAIDYLGREIEVIVTGEYDTNKAGIYTIKYNATDRLGNKAKEETATLVVEEVKPEKPEKPEDTEEFKKLDVNNDGVIDIEDVAIVALAYNKKSSQNNWNPALDINGDNIIDIYDLVKIVNKL